MDGEEQRDQLLEKARAAHRKHQYDVAYRTLQAAGEEHSLPADDMRLLADAAWWLGMISECLGLTETLHQRYLAEGRLDRAALHAIDLGGLWFMRGNMRWPRVG